MVCDKLENLNKYIPHSKKEVIGMFVEKIHADMEEGFYEIDGEDVFARVMSYDGKERGACAIEAHNQYVDIQFTLKGIEGIDIFNRAELRTKTEYVIGDDVLFFYDDEKAYVQISNRPGYFSMIFSQEAHRPQIAVNKANTFIKKGVIKIKEKCYE